MQFKFEDYKQYTKTRDRLAACSKILRRISLYGAEQDIVIKMETGAVLFKNPSNSLLSRLKNDPGHICLYAQTTGEYRGHRQSANQAIATKEYSPATRIVS